jgi:hypothetical protein
MRAEVVPASEAEPDGWKAAGKFTVVLETCMPTTTMPGAAPRSSPAVGAGLAARVLAAPGFEQQSLLGIHVPNCEVPARLPKPTVRQQSGGRRVGGGFWGLGTTIDPTTTGPGSSRPISVTAILPPPYAYSAPIPTRRPASNTRAVGADPPTAGARKR